MLLKHYLTLSTVERLMSENYKRFHMGFSKVKIGRADGLGNAQSSSGPGIHLAVGRINMQGQPL
jgi:hypothetical protein